MCTRKGDKFKARSVARGFQEEDNIRADSPTIGKSAARLTLAIAASNKWALKSTDIKSAFLQSDRLDRDVYIMPPKEANCQGKVWLIKKELVRPK